MLLSLLFQEPAFFAAWVVAILVAIAIHEFAHAFSAYLMGDPTARDLGRLTFNPFAHIDIMGFLLLLLVGFGWGKPVPFNPYNLRYKKWGPAIVSLAGPFSNLILIIFFGIILKLLITYTTLDPANLLLTFFVLLIQINVVLMVFNLIPIPPLDGSKLLFTFLPRSLDNVRLFLERSGMLLLLGIIIADRLFNFGIFSSLFNWLLSLIYRSIG